MSEKTIWDKLHLWVELRRGAVWEDPVLEKLINDAEADYKNCNQANIDLKRKLEATRKLAQDLYWYGQNGPSEGSLLVPRRRVGEELLKILESPP